MSFGFEGEIETIREAQRGDSMAWEALVSQNVGWVYHTCSRWTGSRSRAEDLTQDVFIRVFRTLHSYRGDLAGFRTWLSRVTRNLLIDNYRRNCRERLQVSYDSADEQIQGVIRSIHSPECSPEGNMERLERRAALRKALRLVGPQLQEAVILRDVQGLTYQEISQLLETPVGTVKSRVNRGRIELARLVRQRAALLPGFESKASAVA